MISAESLAAGGGRGRYDVVVASEVLEHVAKPHALLGVLASLLAPQETTPGAAVVVSTLNRWGCACRGPGPGCGTREAGGGVGGVTDVGTATQGPKAGGPAQVAVGVWCRIRQVGVGAERHETT